MFSPRVSWLPFSNSSVSEAANATDKTNPKSIFFIFYSLFYSTYCIYYDYKVISHRLKG
jgi:hypothetical protein